MLSNKMTVSLMSLITIIALAFVVTPAMAGEFGVSLDKTGDVSTATGDLELVHPGDGMKITLRVEFAKAVILGKESVQIITIDKDGELLSLQKFPAAAEKVGDAGRIKTFSPVVEGSATTVKLLIAAGIASADPFNTDTSAKLEATIHLIGADDGPPTVYSITRAVDDDHAFAKISPKTDPTIEVRITLSELPKEFTKDHISVTEADVTSVRQLLTESGTILMDYLASDDAPDSLPRMRMIHDEDFEADDETDVIAINELVTLTGSPTKAQLDAREMYGGIHRAINEAKFITGTAYKYKSQDAATRNNNALTIPDPVDVEFGTTTAAASDPNPATVALTVGAATEVSDSIGAPSKPDKTVAMPTAPKLSDFGAADLFQAAADEFISDFDEYRMNANAWAQYNAYMAAKMAEEMMDADARAEAYAELDNPPVVSFATGTDAMLYPYLVVITPKYANTNDVVVKVKEFEDRTRPIADKYIPPSLESDYTEGVDKLTIMVSEAKPGAILTAGFEVVIPKEIRIPASGFTVFAKNNAGSGIKDNPGNDKDEPKATERTPAQLLYNLVELSGLPNLETFLANGGTIDLVGPAGVYISEVMWGSDASLSPNSNSQWIEIANKGATSILTGDKTHKFIFYGLNETLPAVSTVADRIGTVGAGGYWSTAGKGMSGRTGTGEAAADVVAVVPTQELVSMQRVMDAAGAPADGTMASSWVASTGSGLNFDLNSVGVRVGTPGASPVDRPVTPTPVTPAPTVPVAEASDIKITEIMVDTDNGRLPQWIELTHVGSGEVSLDGWEMVIDNAIDADVIGGGNAITVSLSGVTLDVSAHPGNTGKGQSALVVAWTTSRVSTNIRTDRVINLATQLNQTDRYQLLSYESFRITLVPPQTGAIAPVRDIAGNLDEAWEIPMEEGTARSSMIRREMLADGTATMGTDENGWVLASSTSLITGQPSYYGSDEDAGTPGHDIGGPLPVELSHFRPARDKATGQVVITWSTQSELNNAGFFIKRSQQRNGQFKVVNPTMVPGAGTTSEKQFYTYTDTTAQPNVVYYYQIEDVSLDGNRQTLTLGTRLKGHVGAAGKLTSTWGELKSSNE